MKQKPRVALLRGPLLNPFEMQSYEPLQEDFDLVAFVPHKTQFDLSSIAIPRQILWCPISGKTPFERTRRKWQAARDAVTGNTHTFCGMLDRLKGFDLYHIKDLPFCFDYEAALAKRSYGGKMVVTVAENIPHLNEHKFMERHIKRTVGEEVDLFLAISEGAKKALMEEGVPEEKIRRISNSIDTDFFKPGPAEPRLLQSLGIPRNAFRVLYVGRLARSKGVFTLLEAARRLAGSHSGCHFLFIGKDEEGAADWIQCHGLQNKVHLLDFIPYSQMPRYYRLADLLILPSLPTKRWVEQFGYVLAESMACGVPAVGSDCGAIPEVIGDPGMIFPAGSVEGLCGILERLRKRNMKSLGLKVRKRAAGLFSSKNLTKTLRKTYNELLCKP